jgi:hypothetical protein
MPRSDWPSGLRRAAFYLPQLDQYGDGENVHVPYKAEDEPHPSDLYGQSPFNSLQADVSKSRQMLNWAPSSALMKA